MSERKVNATVVEHVFGTVNTQDGRKEPVLDVTFTADDGSDVPSYRMWLSENKASGERKSEKQLDFMDKTMTSLGFNLDGDVVDQLGTKGYIAGNKVRLVIEEDKDFRTGEIRGEKVKYINRRGGAAWAEGEEMDELKNMVSGFLNRERNTEEVL